MQPSSALPARITMLSGGVGGSRFAQGVRHLIRRSATSLTCIVNTGDDMWLNGLRVCPDLDSMMYGLAGVNDRDRGWGGPGRRSA